MTEPMWTLSVRTGAWDGDSMLTLPVPSTWDVQELRMRPSAPLSEQEIAAAVARPVAGPPLIERARGSKAVALIVDDLTRPTAAGRILPSVLDALSAAGIPDGALTLFISTGSHAPPSHADIALKVGASVSRFNRIVVHDCHGPCADLGRTDRGTPVAVNAALMECDLKIGVSGVFPHPAAAFSGGTKVLAPGMCGAETIRFLHDHVRPARLRGGPLDAEFRREMDEIASRAGLDIAILAVPGPDRSPVHCVSGSPVAAFEHAVALARAVMTVALPPVGDIDAIVLDAYPFDGTLQFAHDRALWPLAHYPHGLPALLLAGCARGKGEHEFFPAADPLFVRVHRRLTGLRLHDLQRIPEIARNARALVAARERRLILHAEGVGPEDVRRVFPHGTRAGTWEDACRLLDAGRKQGRFRVAFFHTAPLLLPFHEAGKP